MNTNPPPKPNPEIEDVFRNMNCEMMVCFVLELWNMSTVTTEHTVTRQLYLSI